MRRRGEEKSLYFGVKRSFFSTGVGLGVASEDGECFVAGELHGPTYREDRYVRIEIDRARKGKIEQSYLESGASPSRELEELALGRRLVDSTL
jgi:hypothetical protein